MPITSILPRAAVLVSRATCYDNNYYSGYNGYGGSYNCNSAWYRWGRWVLAGILIFIGIFLVLLFAFCARRRTRRNRNRITNTNTPMTVQQPDYNNDQPVYAPPAEAPPIYSGNGSYVAGPGTHGYYGAYNGQQGGVTVPQGAYVK